MGVNSGTLHLILFKFVFCINFPPPPPSRPAPLNFTCFFGFWATALPPLPPLPPPASPSLPPPLPLLLPCALLFHILSPCWSPASRGGRRSLKIRLYCRILLCPPGPAGICRVPVSHTAKKPRSPTASRSPKATMLPKDPPQQNAAPSADFVSTVTSYTYLI